MTRRQPSRWLRTRWAHARRVLVQRVALPVLGWAPARRVTLTLARARFERSARIGGVVDRILIAGTPDPAERARSVDELVDLFFDLCALARVDVFVEAGAKEASAAQRAAAAGTDHVVAFEANPYTHRRFADGLAQAGIDYRHTALSDRAGEVTFLVRLREDGTPIPDGQGSLLVRPDHTPGYEEVTVPAVTLDDAGIEDGRVAMWVDVEGAVAEVFGGAAQLLERTDVVIVEVEATRRWEGQRWLADDVVAHLAAFGLGAVGRDMQSRWQFNTLFVRNALLSDPQVVARIGAWRRGPSVANG